MFDESIHQAVGYATGNTTYYSVLRALDWSLFLEIQISTSRRRIGPDCTSRAAPWI